MAELFTDRARRGGPGRGRIVNRLALAVFAFASLFAVSPVVADAGPTKSVSYTLDGSSHWSSPDLPSLFAVGGDVADAKRAVGTYGGTISITGFSPCAEPNNPYGPTCASPTGGTLTFTVKGGSFTAAVDGGTVWKAFTGPSADVYVFELTLTVTGGTHAYASASGTLSLHYETARSNLTPDPVTLAPCRTIDITTCPIRDLGAVTGTISR